jgi:hypothetical protein
MISIQASVSKGWLNKSGGFTFGETYYFDPLFRFEEDKKISAFVRENFPNYPVYNMEDNLMQAEYISDKQILVCGLQPNLILGSILGSKPIFFEDKDTDIHSKPLENLNSVIELQELPSLLSTPLIMKLTGQISELKKKHPDYKIIPPFFWDASGRATIHGIITTSLKLMGEDVFVLMASDPALVHAVHKWITDAYIHLINYFSSFVGLTVSSIHIGECSCTMLSSRHFEEFVVPYINMLGNEYKKIRFHSCGKSDALIDSFTKIPALSALDVGSGTSLKSIRKQFGNKVSISTFPSPELLVKGAPKEKIIFWLDELIKDNNDGDLRISYHVEPDYEIDNCIAINQHLEKKYNIKQTRLEI